MVFVGVKVEKFYASTEKVHGNYGCARVTVLRETFATLVGDMNNRILIIVRRIST